MLIYGIANPKPLKAYLNKNAPGYERMAFDDHHIFDSDDLREIKKRFDKIESDNKIILTTEKDGVRLVKFENELKDLPVYVIPIRHKIMFGEENVFNESIITFVKNCCKKSIT